MSFKKSALLATLTWILLLASVSIRADSNAESARAEKEFKQAAQAYQAKNYQEAATRYNRVIELIPGNAKGWLFLGQSLAHVNDNMGARRAFAQVLSLSPSGLVADRALEQLSKLPEPDLLTMRLASGITLGDWMKQVKKAPMPGQRETIFGEIKQYLNQFGPVPQLLALQEQMKQEMQVEQQGLKKAISLIKVSNDENSQIALPQIRQLRAQAPSNLTLLQLEAKACHLTQDFSCAEAAYSTWLKTAPGNDRKREVMVNALLQARKHEALPYRKPVAALARLTIYRVSASQLRGTVIGMKMKSNGIEKDLGDLPSGSYFTTEIVPGSHQIEVYHAKGFFSSTRTLDGEKTFEFKAGQNCYLEVQLRTSAGWGLAMKSEEQAKAELTQISQVQPITPVKAGGPVNAGEPFIKDCDICPEMVEIPGGTFEMGSNFHDSQIPIHSVSIDEFALGRTEITQGQWRAVMGNNPSEFSICGDDCPVDQVSWDDAQLFIHKLNARTGKQYRLPSEAEWEYACRAGGQQEYCGSDSVDSVAWYDGNSGEKAHSVSRKQPNAFGLYDMSGNVWEWVEDSWHDNYNDAITDGSVWKGDGAKRVLRGGSWYLSPQFARAANRGRFDPAIRLVNGGFRVARMLP